MILKTFADRFKTIANWIGRHRFIQPYWVEITTKQPSCIYYFGPFDSYTDSGFQLDRKQNAQFSLDSVTDKVGTLM